MAFGDRFADLDELVLLCRNKQAREYIAEAIACYRTGAFRASIVSTWIAVVFDFIHKLQELALTGDKEAQKIADSLDEVHRIGNWQSSIDFEKKILDIAKNQFELLSALQYEDLKRLFEDRNRCAHPSMLSLEEPYQPTGELARYHLRNAITHLLQYPPVQGKAALSRIWSEIKSESFPISIEEAVDRFQHGPLVRARRSLIRNLIIGITKSLLLENRPTLEQQRQFTALNAVLQMYPDIGETVLQEEFPKIVQCVDKHEWIKIIVHFHCVPIVWNTVGDLTRKQALTFVSVHAKNHNIATIGHTIHVPALREIVIPYLQKLSPEALTNVIRIRPHPDYVDIAIQNFAKAKSFNEGNNLAKSLLQPLIPLLSKEQVIHAANAFLNNFQLHGSHATINVIEELFLYSKQYKEETRDIWVKIYGKLGIWGLERYDRNGTLYDGHSLFPLIEQRYPDVLSLVDDDVKKRLQGF